MQLLKAYDKLLISHPIKTKTITSGFLFGLGDFICQNYIEKQEQYNPKRTGYMVIMGTVSGPIFHCWYGFLSGLKFTQKLSPLPSALVSMAIDQTAFAYLYLSFFLFTLNTMESKDPQKALKLREEKIFETLVANWKIWPLAQLINFSLIPTPYRVLWANMVGLAWNVIASFIAHKKE